MTPDVFRTALGIAVHKVPEWIGAPEFTLDVTLINRSPTILCNRPAGSEHWFTISYLLRQQDKHIVVEGLRSRTADILKPGESVTYAARLAVPDRVGRYEIEVLPLLKTVAWGQERARLAVDVVEATPGAFRARVQEVPPGEPTRAGSG